MTNNYQAQIVHFDSMESEIENMYIKNGSGGCTVFETDVNVHNLLMIRIVSEERKHWVMC